MKDGLQHPEQWIGQPVCIGLTNGEVYIAHVLDVRNGTIIFSGMKGTDKLPKNRKPNQAQISALLGSMLGSELGAPGGVASGIGGLAPTAGGTGGMGGMLGGLSRMWPMFQMGLGMLRFITPLMGRMFV